MSQRRMVHSKIWASDQVGAISDPARVLYVGTITLSDDEGRLRASPAYLRGQVFPYDDKTIENVTELRAELVNQKLVHLYEHDGAEYMYHPRWLDYQWIRKDRFRKSQLPKPRTA